MKKTYFIWLIAIFFGSAKAQNFTIVLYDTVKYGNPKDLLLPTITFSNNTSSPVQMMLQRIVKNIPAGWTSCFCAPTCVAQTQDTIWFTIPVEGDKVNPGAVRNVSPNFGTDSIPGEGEVVIVFTEAGSNIFDTVRFRGITSSLAGIKSIADESKISVYPNPSTDYVIIDGIKMSEIKITDTRGTELTCLRTDSSQGRNVVDVSHLNAGVYYFILRLSDGTQVRRKVVKL